MSHASILRIRWIFNWSRDTAVCFVCISFYREEKRRKKRKAKCSRIRRNTQGEWMRLKNELWKVATNVSSCYCWCCNCYFVFFFFLFLFILIRLSKSILHSMNKSNFLTLFARSDLLFSTPMSNFVREANCASQTRITFNSIESRKILPLVTDNEHEMTFAREFFFLSPTFTFTSFETLAVFFE